MGCTQRAWRAVGRRKVASFLTYAKLYPEYRFVFVGDNGQADVLTAEMMAQSSCNVLGSFIHEVYPVSRTLTSLPDGPDLDAWNAQGIHFFQTYVGAALAALKMEIISVETLAKIVTEAVQDCRIELHRRNLKLLSRGSEKKKAALPKFGKIKVGPAPDAVIERL